MAIEPTLSSIHQQYFTDQGKEANQTLRHDEGKELYAHTKMSSTSFKNVPLLGKFVSEDRVQQRDQKKMDGAAFIKQAINREFGTGMADRVFGHILNQTGQNMSQGVTRGDLGTLLDTANTLWQQDLAQGKNLSDLGSVSGLKYANDALVAINDGTLTNQLRDQIATGLRGAIMGSDLNTLNTVFQSGALKSDELRNVLNASMSDGTPLFNEQDKRMLMNNILPDYARSENNDTFMRKGSVASVVMNEAILSAGGGRIGEIKEQIKDIIVEGYGVYPGELDWAEEKNTDTLQIIDRLDEFFRETDLGQELRDVFGDIREIVNDTRDSHGWDGSDFAMNTLMLRGLVGADLVMAVRAETGAGSGDRTDPGGNAVAFMQRIVNAGDEFNVGERKFMDLELQFRRLPDSGFSNLFDQVRN